mmetsp:Transcript_6074/g.19834  ORF Transcript_6074/g.19834 Transcript_6074/m.19834 type:complete len:343 (+) Transcript_6074:134-1162(+)
MCCASGTNVRVVVQPDPARVDLQAVEEGVHRRGGYADGVGSVCHRVPQHLTVGQSNQEHVRAWGELGIELCECAEGCVAKGVDGRHVGQRVVTVAHVVANERDDDEGWVVRGLPRKVVDNGRVAGTGPRTVHPHILKVTVDAKVTFAHEFVHRVDGRARRRLSKARVGGTHGPVHLVFEQRLEAGKDLLAQGVDGSGVQHVGWNFKVCGGRVAEHHKAQLVRAVAPQFFVRAAAVRRRAVDAVAVGVDGRVTVRCCRTWVPVRVGVVAVLATPVRTTKSVRLGVTVLVEVEQRLMHRERLKQVLEVVPQLRPNKLTVGTDKGRNVVVCLLHRPQRALWVIMA